MRTSLLASVPVLLLLVGCGSEPPPVTTPPPPVEAPRASASAPPPVVAPPVVDARPTQLTPAELARDEARVPAAKAIVAAFGNDNPILSPDGKHFLFTSDRSGVSQIYLGEVGKPAAEPVAITRGAERAGPADFTRDGKSILVLRDEGADENYRIFSVGLDGKGERSLTPAGKLHRDPPVLPRAKADVMIYTQHDVKSAASDLVVQRISGGEPKVIYTDPAPAFASDATADGARALVLRWVSSSELILFEIDVAKGKARRVFPAEGAKMALNDARYSADGKRVFVSGDDGGSKQMLYALDAATGKIVKTYEQTSPPTAFVSTVQVSPRGDRVAIGVNAGNHSEVRILDAKTLTQTATVKAPLGVLEIGKFSDDGKRFGLYASTPQAPVDVFAVDAATGAMTPLRTDERPGLASLAPLTSSIETVKAHDGLTLPMNVYQSNAPGKRPVIVQFHGGPSWSYQVRWSESVRFLTSLGYVVVEPNVRGSTGFGRAYEMADDREKRADWLRDLETVNGWVKAQPWADPAKVVVAGGSYGGYTVLMALTRQPKLWRAGIDLFGVANLFTFLASTDQAIRAGFVQEFGDLEKDKALLEEFSPMRDVDKIVAPLFVYAGANDPRVPRTECDLIVQALRKSRVPVEYMVAPNEGHSLDRRENRIEYLTRVARFLEDQVK